MSSQAQHFYEFGPFCLDTRERVLLREGKPVPLKPKVYETLLALVAKSRHIVDKEELMRQVWPDVIVEENNLTGNIFALRRAFGEHQYIETIPRRGYRFAAEVTLVQIEDIKLSLAGKETAVQIKETLSRVRTTIDSLAVLPFINASAEPESEYLSDGITESIINNLSQLSALRVMARNTVFRFKGKEANAREAGQELGVAAVLLGRVLQFDGRLILRTELVDVESGGQLWGQQYNRELVDIFSVQEEIAREISEGLRLKLRTEEKRLLTKRYTENTEAYHAYLKGRYFWNKRTEPELRKGIEYFQQAIDIDPKYALAYAGLADGYAVLGNFSFLTPAASYPKARTAAIRALEIDGRMADAHASLAWIKAQYDWDWTGAERKFKQAIDLNPDYAPAHYWCGLFLSAMGRHAEAIAAGNRAKELEPLSLVPNTALGMILYFARQYADAIEQLLRTVEMEPHFSWARCFLGGAYERKGMYTDAVAQFEIAVNATGSRTFSLAVLGHGYAASGDRANARKVLAELQQIHKRQYVAPFFMALICTALGENDRAWDWLEKAYEGRSWGLLWLKVDPRLDSLHSDPRFMDLLGRIGLA